MLGEAVFQHIKENTVPTPSRKSSMCEKRHKLFFGLVSYVNVIISLIRLAPCL